MSELLNKNKIDLIFSPKQNIKKRWTKHTYRKELLIETCKFDNELLSGGLGNMIIYHSSLVLNLTRQDEYREKDFKKNFKVIKNRFRG